MRTNGQLDETDAIADWRAIAAANVRSAGDAVRSVAQPARDNAREWPETFDERQTRCTLPRS